jgi:hypothetical protein
MPLQVRLNFARIEGREIFIDLFENQVTRLLAQTRVQHPEKLRLNGKSQSLIPLMEPSLFDVVGDDLREFFAILLAERPSTIVDGRVENAASVSETRDKQIENVAGALTSRFVVRE